MLKESEASAEQLIMESEIALLVKRIMPLLETDGEVDPELIEDVINNLLDESEKIYSATELRLEDNQKSQLSEALRYALSGHLGKRLSEQRPEVVNSLVEILYGELSYIKLTHYASSLISTYNNADKKSENE